MRLFKFLLPVFVLVAAVVLAKYFLATGPEARKKPFVKKVSVVETQPLAVSSYTVKINASGIVRAGIQTNLVSEVSGRVVDISDKFLEGNYFNKGQTLLSIDSSSYKNSLAIAESDVAANKASLVQLIEEEKSTKRSFNLAVKNLKLGQKEVLRLRSLWNKKLIARSALDTEDQKLNQLEQKREDLQGIINGYKSRKMAAEAKINASKTRLKQEKLTLTKTVITAPYSGRVFNRNVDAGQFVGTGTVLGKIYGTEYVYVDLPLSLAKYELLNIPEQFQDVTTQAKLPDVLFTNSSQKNNSRWKGVVVRSSAALDADSRQIKVIAKIESPFKASADVSAPIKVGQYLNAEIAGRTFSNIYKIPPAAIRQNKEILLLKEGVVHIVPIDVLWNADKETIVRTAEKLDGKDLITTVLTQATEGMKVMTLEQQREANKSRKKRKPKKKEEPKSFIENFKSVFFKSDEQKESVADKRGSNSEKPNKQNSVKENPKGEQGKSEDRKGEPEGEMKRGEDKS